MRLATFDCFAGVSGDMTLGALVSAGWAAEELQALPGRLGLPEVTIEVAPVRRGPFAATHVRVVHPPQKAHRHLHHIAAILEQADLSASVRERALAVFTRLAEAEANLPARTGLRFDPRWQQLRATLEARVLQADVLFLPGGDPDALLSALRFFDLKPALLETLRRGATFFSISAGSLAGTWSWAL